MWTLKDAVADTLEQLWISYNLIEKLKGIAVLKKLKVEINIHMDLSITANLFIGVIHV